MLTATLFAALLSTPALPPLPGEQAAGTSDKKVCRRIMQTESRIPPPPVCKTQAEWDREAREEREGLDRSRARHHNPGNRLD